MDAGRRLSDGRDRRRETSSSSLHARSPPPAPRRTLFLRGTIPKKRTAWQLLAGSVALLAGAAGLERAGAVRWEGTFLALLLFLALVGTAFAPSLWYWLVQREDVGRLSLLLFLVPVFGLALASLLFGERIGAAEAAGVGLTLAAIGLVVRAAWRGGGAAAG